jgi:hypothetical protein
MSQETMTLLYSYLCPTVIRTAILSHPFARQVSRDVPMHADFLGGKAAVLRDARKQTLHCLCGF